MSQSASYSIVFAAHAQVGLSSTFATLRDVAVRLEVAYRPLGVHGALLLQRGFFLHWLQGEHEAVEQARREAIASGVFVDPTELFGGPSPDVLTDEWTLVWMQRSESRVDIYRRIQMLELTRRAGLKTTPIHVWRAFSTADVSRVSPSGEATRPLQRAIIVGHAASVGLDVVSVAARGANVGISASRVASTATRLADVATSFVDVPTEGQATLRLMAIARKGLKVGMSRLFVRDASWLVIAADTTDQDVRNLFAEVQEALSLAGAKPIIIGLSASLSTLDLLAKLSRSARYRFCAVNTAAVDAEQAWVALLPMLLDMATTEPTPTLPMRRDGRQP